MPPRKGTRRKSPAQAEVSTAQTDTVEPLVQDTSRKLLGEVFEGIPYFLKAGDVISLDLRKATYVILPGLRMSPDTPTATIPDNISEEDLKALMRMMEARHIVKGNVHVPVFPKNSGTIHKFVELLRHDAPTMKKWVGKAVQKGRRAYIDGHHVYNIIQAMISHEQKNQFRKAHLAILQSALRHVRSDTFSIGPVANVSSEDVLKEDSMRHVFEQRRQASRSIGKGRKPV